MENKQSRLLEKQKLMYKSLTHEQLNIVNEYFVDDMKKLKKVCDPIIFRKGIPLMDHDELYDVASATLVESLVAYDKSKGCKFQTYLTGNINRAFYDWTRDQRRAKRCNVLMKDGKIVKDKDGIPIVIPNIPIDAPTEEGIELHEKIASSFDIEDELTKEIGISSGSKMEKYLDRLSKKQRQVAVYLSEGYKPPEIREILHITEKEYSDCMMAIRSYKNISILF